MNDGPSIAATAALIGDPARANILLALMDGRALTVTELAHAGGVSIQTASGHISKLTDSGLLVVRKQGRHRYLALSGPEVADVIERLMGIAARTMRRPGRTGPRDEALRTARLCYDHLAGERGVQLLDSLTSRGLIRDHDDIALTDDGVAFVDQFGIAVAGLRRTRRPICLKCLDWSERRHHLAGALGAAVFTRLRELDWVRQVEGRLVRFTSEGLTEFDRAFPIGPDRETRCA